MKLEITSVSGFLYASPSYRVRPNSRYHIQALIKPNYRTKGLIAGRGHFARAEILGGVKRRLCPEPGPRADLITWRAAAQSRYRVHVHLAQITVSAGTWRAAAQSRVEYTYIWLKQQSLSHTFKSKLIR